MHIVGVSGIFLITFCHILGLFFSAHFVTISDLFNTFSDFFLAISADFQAKFSTFPEENLAHLKNPKQYSHPCLQEMLSRIQTQLTEVKQTIQEINWSRKDQQTKVGERLKQLESNWVGLVSKNYEIEQAVITMEHEYNILKYEHDQQKEKEQTVQWLEIFFH